MRKKIKNKSLGGRPEKQLDEKDWKILNNAILFGTADYCSRQVGLSVSTLDRKIKEKYGVGFKVLKKQKEEEINNNLFLKQYQVAMSGNVSMLIFLGKNRLGQSDKQGLIGDLSINLERASEN